VHSKVTNLKNKSLYKVNQIENLIDNLKAFKMDLNLQNNKANNQEKEVVMRVIKYLGEVWVQVVNRVINDIQIIEEIEDLKV